MSGPFNSQQQRRISSCRLSAGLMDGSSNTFQEELETTELSRGHSNAIKAILKELSKLTFHQGPSQRDVGRTSGRINKNAVLALVLIRLIKYRYLRGVRLAYEMELLRDIPMQLNYDEFVLVLRTNGRIVVMSDEAEQHLKKSMRLLYAQSVNIFECLDDTDAVKLRSVLETSTSPDHQEHRLVVTFRLPKGRRPSRLLEDVKTISMVGHFYSCDNLSATAFDERLFIARCTALIPLKIAKPGSIRTTATTDNDTTGSAALTLTLNDDMSIYKVSANLCSILGYSIDEMVGQWFGRYLPVHDGEKFEALRQNYLQNEQHPQQSPTSVNEIFDVYANGGDSRLTFLCQIRPTREPRSRVMKFTVVAQLIDPSLRNEYAQYISSESERQPEASKAEQSAHHYRKRAKIQSWPTAQRPQTWQRPSTAIPSTTVACINRSPPRSTSRSQALLHRSTSVTSFGETSSRSMTASTQQHPATSSAGHRYASTMPSPRTDSPKSSPN